MWAIIETGGKQYQVKESDKLKIEKLEGEVGSKLKFERVLLLSEDEKGEKISIGQPILEKASVEGKILEQAKDEKLIVFKYKPKKRYRVKKGHRQNYTLVEITNITK